MKYSKILFLRLLIVWMLCHSFVASGQQVDYHEAISSAKQLLLELKDFQKVPGIAVSVSVNEQIVWSEGLGYADLEHEVSVNPATTKFRIGSVSKPYTTSALALLYEAGKIDLDAAIQTYVPDFPEKRATITPRLLAGHLAGIRHYRGEEFLSDTYYATVGEGLTIFQDDTLLFEPGSQYAYSSYGYNLLSAAIEGACGEAFLTYMQRAVFDPLEMEQTYAEHMDSIIVGRAEYYIKAINGTVLNAPFVDNSYKWAGGGFISTTEDMLKLGHAYLRSDFIADSTITRFITSQHTTDGEETGYGIGWRSDQDEKGLSWFGHSGGSVGGSTQFLIYPAERLVIAIAGNMSGINYGAVPQQIAAMFIEQRR